jgi:transketolase
VLFVSDGNEVDPIDLAIQRAKKDDRPSLIICRTQIGYGLPNKQNSASAHGEPPGEPELLAAKENLNWPLKPWFYVPDDALAHFREAITKGKVENEKWQELKERYHVKYPKLAKELDRRLIGKLPHGWDVDLLNFPGDGKGFATRAVSGKTLNALAARIPDLMGGSADLAPSNKTWIEDSPAFQAESPIGRNIHFGVREHAMGAIVNGLALHGGIIPFGGTFLVFSDYMRPAIRLSALSGYPSIWVFTHDSIGLGEDGPTHQPIEHLAALRAIPNLVLIRPCDANEVVEAWKFAIKHRDGPTALAFTRQSVPTLDRSIYSPASGLQRGAYVLADYGDQAPEIILMASGSEVDLIVKAAGNLAAEGINVRIVSFPSWEIFAEQDQDYQDSVLIPELKTRIAAEAGVSQGWERWVGDDGAIIAIDRFGASAPYKLLYDQFGLTVDNIVSNARKLI